MVHLSQMGHLAEDFDLLYKDLWMEQESYEKAHRLLLEKAIEVAFTKGKVNKEDVQFFLAGDLINQITPTSFAARTNADSVFRIVWCLLYIHGGTCISVVYRQLRRCKYGINRCIES